MEQTLHEEEEEDKAVREILKGKINQPFGFLETVIHYYNRITLRVLGRLGIGLYTIVVPLFWLIIFSMDVEPAPVWKTIVLSFIITLFTYLISFVIGGGVVFGLCLLYKMIPQYWKWVWEDKK